MAQIVKCDVCGKTYNQSRLSSHKRLSHGIGKTSNSSSADEPQKLETVLALYGQLSEESKKQLRNQLTAADSKVD